MSQPTTRQEIYDRIRATSKDAYVLTEMKRLGFGLKMQTNRALPKPSSTARANCKENLMRYIQKGIVSITKS